METIAYKNSFLKIFQTKLFSSNTSTYIEQRDEERRKEKLKKKKLELNNKADRNKQKKKKKKKEKKKKLPKQIVFFDNLLSILKARGQAIHPNKPEK